MEFQESVSSRKRVWVTKSGRHIVLRVNLHVININEYDTICTMKIAEYSPEKWQPLIYINEHVLGSRKI